MKTSFAVTLAVLSTSLLLVGCAGPQRGAVTDRPFLVDKETGDRPDLAEAQMGLEETPSHSIEGDVPFGDAVRVTCGPASVGPHPAFHVTFADRNGELTVVVHHHTPGGHEGEQEVEAVLTRVGSEGGVLQSEGRGTATLESAADQAGVFAASGSFQVELSGQAGQGSVSGSFEECYYFT